MNIFIVTAGSRGDVQPFVALGKGLKAKGHEVTLCTCSRFEPFITEHGLNYGYMNDNLLKLLDSEVGREVIESSGNLLGLVKTTLTLFKEAKELNREMFQDAWNVAQAAQPDILIFHPKILAGSHIAEKLNIPTIMATLVPAIVPTAESVAIGFPNLKLGSWYNKFSYWILHQGYHLYDDVINEFRQNILGLGKLPKSINPIQMSNGQPLPILHGYSELVSPRPGDWSDTVRVSGYWFLEVKDDYQPSAELINFLEAGEAPVCVGFGSMAGRDPQRMTEIVVDAFQQAEVRGIIVTGWGGLNPNHLPKTIFKIDNIPYDWLFPRVSVVVHHGGAGTTAQDCAQVNRPSFVLF